ncbi:class I SAM-dependent methyltransferase [Estrella lausannensis]|uniref:Methyltransferase n=1 Tax=Estrella lausannensis TaxID=483423 RepID=A0A0H5DRF7_9BACT|nr:class I SAM-dependent methyltransferase [Estrella lausannensis]CRX39167.1 Methyltransferase [Estrella lausannensis]
MTVSMSTLSTSSYSSRLISQTELHVRFEEAEKSKKLELQGYSFDPDRFQALLRFLTTATQLTKLKVTKALLDSEQEAKILSTTNRNLMKGIKIEDEQGRRFGNAYTDWHEYNMAKMTLCKLHDTTEAALQKFDSLPGHVIDFGSGTGQETMALLEMGCPSVVAIDGDREAIEILKKKATSYLNEGTLQTYRGPFMEYNSERKADLFIASFTWPYRPPQDFAECWGQCLANLKPGGWIAGHFFGSPAMPDAGMTYHSEDELINLLNMDFEEISIRVKEKENQAVFGGSNPPWGALYHVVAKKRERNLM